MTPLIYTNKIKAFSAYLCLCSLVALVLLVFAQQAQAQAGRNPVSARRTTVVPLNVRFTEDKTKPRPLLGSKNLQEVEKILTKDKVEQIGRASCRERVYSPV